MLFRSGIADLLPVSPEFLEKQLQCVFTDIVPDAVKVGMITGKEQMRVIRDFLVKYQAKHVVMDTVMVSTSGRRLMEPEAFDYYAQKLLPLAEIYTPNLPEAEFLLKRTVKTRKERVAAVREFALQYRGMVYLKGGHDGFAADDLLFDGKDIVWLKAAHISNNNTHGTGCTLSAAIACGLARGLDCTDSARMAKEYITGAIADGMDLGRGTGPLNHMYRMKET